MNEQETILIVDDDENTRKSLSLIFNKKGYETETAGTCQEAIDKAQERFLNLALLDVRLPDMEGVALLATLKAMHPDMVIIMATAYASLETAVQALNKGASAYITKPLNMDEVLAAVREALEKQRLVLENRRLYQEIQRELPERRRAEEEIRQRTAQLEALRQVGLNLTAQLDLETLLHAIVAQAIELLQGRAGGLYLHQREREVLEWVTVVGPSSIPLGSTLRRGEGLSGTVWETGKPLIVNDYQHWEGRAPIYEDIPNLVVVGAPVRWGEQFLGVLTVEDAPPRTFSQVEAELLSLFATQAAIAIRNARLYEQANRRLSEARLVQEVMLATASTLDFNFALERTLKALHRALNIDHLGFMLPGEHNDRLVSHPSLVSATVNGAFQVPLENGLVGRAYRTGQPVLVQDTAQEPAHLDLRPEARSALAVPVRVGDRIAAVLHAESPRAGAFGEDELRLFTTVAGQLGVTLENTRLFAETQKWAQQLEQLVQERTAELQTQYARLEAVLRSATDGIVVTDADGEILQSNPVALAWLSQTLSPDDTTKLQQAVQDLAHRAEERPETQLELAGLDLELKAAPVVEDEAKCPKAAVVAIHDISHLKALDRMRSRFVSNVSHELRTPVTTIKLYAALMRQTSPDSEEWEKYLNALAQEADRQAQLVANILHISRIDTGRLELEPRPVSLSEMCAETVDNHHLLAQERGLTLEHRSEQSEPMILADQVQMMQVLNNLVQNAIRYTPAGGEIVVATAQEQARDRTWAVVTVSDTGMGIPEDELPHIFERFFRGEKPRLMQVSGTGLGLAIVKEIVELHGGWVTVESQVDLGTTFTIWLPLAR